MKIKETPRELYFRLKATVDEPGIDIMYLRYKDGDTALDENGERYLHFYSLYIDFDDNTTSIREMEKVANDKNFYLFIDSYRGRNFCKEIEWEDSYE